MWKKPYFKIAIKVSNTKNKVNKKHVGSIRKYLIFEQKNIWITCDMSCSLMVKTTNAHLP